MALGDGPVYRFAGRVLDLRRGILATANGPIDLRPKSLAVLVHLVRNAGRVIGRDELITAVWPDVIVGDDSLTQCIRDIRRALGDDAQTLVRTIARRGYLFDAAALEPDEVPEPSALGFGPARPFLDPRLPRVAVLPFALDGDDAAGAYFADGFVEDVVTGLARFRWLFVVASTSSLTFRGPLADPGAAARALAVRYIVGGRLRRSPGRMRVSARLVDAETGVVLWADRFEGASEDVFAIQDQLASAVITALTARILDAEIDQARWKRPDSLDAYDLFLQALPAVRRMRPEDNDRALALARQALAAEPDYAVAAGLAGWALSLRVAQGWRRDEREREAAVDLGWQAIRSGDEHADSDALAMGGYAVAFEGEDLGAGLAAIGRAIDLNPCNALAYQFSGWVRSYSGQARAAVQDLRRAMELSPRDPAQFRVLGGLAFAALLDGDPEAAADWGRAALRLNPRYTPAHRALAAALGHLGRRDEAAAVVEQLRTLVPGLSVSGFARVSLYRFSGRLDTITDGLRAAGLPD
jgi:TolB-like protein/DNA-binding winged helix-turn-helix (wHTH) protein